MGADTDLQVMQDEFDRALSEVANPRDLEDLRVAWLSKKGGRVTKALARLKELPGDERPAYGSAVNRLKQHVDGALNEKSRSLKGRATRDRLAAEALDPTLPAHRPDIGGLHPIRLVQDEIEAIFTSLGYTVMHGPEIETEYHNFEALNIPEDHPARDDHDTFYVPGGVLRTHTSPVQIRTMLGQQPPVRIICPGKVYRCDSDASHAPMFHQFEGLVVGEDITFGDLKGTIDLVFKRLLGPKMKTRLRPSFFPFTEPSAEVDIACVLCGGDGCSCCQGVGWSEVMGCGMVHPAVFEAVGYDPEVYTGFAFGGGIDRLAVQKYCIPHILTFFENDIRFLRQFR